MTERARFAAFAVSNVDNYALSSSINETQSKYLIRLPRLVINVTAVRIKCLFFRYQWLKSTEKKKTGRCRGVILGTPSLVAIAVVERWPL